MRVTNWCLTTCEGEGGCTALRIHLLQYEPFKCARWNCLPAMSALRCSPRYVPSPSPSCIGPSGSLPPSPSPSACEVRSTHAMWATPCSSLSLPNSASSCPPAPPFHLPSFSITPSLSPSLLPSLPSSPPFLPGEPITRSNGLSVGPSALFPTGRGNCFSRHASSGYSPALDGSNSWLISTFFTWNTSAWLPPVQDQEGCCESRGEKGGVGFPIIGHDLVVGLVTAEL